jgi:hypothetical protein
MHNDAPKFDPEQDNLILFQYGKVGSSSLAIPLGQQMRPITKKLKYYPYGDIEDHYPQGAKTHFGPPAKSMIEHMNKSGSGRTWILTITRNRFHRDMSSYFQNVESYFGSKEKVLSMSIPELHDDFRHRFHEYPIEDNDHFWYQSVFKEAVGMNLVDHAASFHDGSLYAEHAYNGKPISIILLRFEDISNWEGILDTYFNDFHIPPHAANKGEEKWYAGVYQQFADSYSFAENEIKLLCEGDTMKFYSEEEKLAMAPQCSASSKLARTVVKEEGRLYALAGNSKLLLEDLSGN